MPSLNPELVHSIYADGGRGDNTATDWADPELEFELVGGLDPGSWSNVAGMTAGWRGWLSAWEGYGIKAEDYRELDNERVLVLVQLSGRGKVSGIRIEDTRARGAEVWHVRDAKVTRLVMYWHRDQALADLGLQE